MPHDTRYGMEILRGMKSMNYSSLPTNNSAYVASFDGNDRGSNFCFFNFSDDSAESLGS